MLLVIGCLHLTIMVLFDLLADARQQPWASGPPPRPPASSDDYDTLGPSGLTEETSLLQPELVEGKEEGVVRHADVYPVSGGYGATSGLCCDQVTTGQLQPY